MSIVTLDKVTIVGHQDHKHDVLEDLQDLGCLHLIPLTPEGEVKEEVGPSRDAREALQFLASAVPRRRQVTDPTRFDAGRIEREALQLQRRLFELRNRRDFLSTRIEHLAPWGDFEFPPREQLAGERFWFFQVPHRQMQEMNRSELCWEVVDRDGRFCYIVVVSPNEPEGMPVERVRTGAVSRHLLLEELEAVEVELEDVEAERIGLTRWCTLFARALDGLEDHSARLQAGVQTAQADPLFALQAWIPRQRIPQLRAYAGDNALAVQVAKADPAETPPTLLHNAPSLRAGEDLVAFYMTPSYWLWDPSSLVFMSFAVFFAMIVADAGYALMLGLLVLLYARRMGTTESGRRWRVMLGTLAAATGVYGVLAGSYFGVTPAPESLPGMLHVLDLNDFSVMMTLSVAIGAAHVAFANVMDALRYASWPLRLPSLGWAGATVGGFLAWWGSQMNNTMLTYAGMGLLALGLVMVVGFSGYGQGPLNRVLRGVTALTGISGAFGDVMSYLRLFALGLASASLAMAFNDMARDVREAVPGIGFFFGLLILVLGHGLNFLLSVASGFIHGLRLNVIEFFKWGVQEEGNPYRPFERKEEH